MKCQIPQICWHSRDPVLSIDFQPVQSDQFRLASGGTDSHVLIWYVMYLENKTVKVECASDLNRHNKSVNVVRFSPSGEFLASGDDEGAMFVWQLKEKEEIDSPKDDENINKEEWCPMKLLRGHLEDISDISWSKDGNFLVSASMDNTAIVWDMQKFVKIHMFSEFKGYVQGVTWDPCNQFIASLGSDRTLRIHNIGSKKVVCRVSKAPWSQSSEKGTFKPRLFFDDTLKSYCRRLSYTPDGELLIVPSGISEKGEKLTNTCYIFSRHVPHKPVTTIPTGDWYTIAVRCNPFLYKLRKEEDVSNASVEQENEKPKTMINLPYRMIFAVAACDSVLMYDTEELQPFACISNIHYTHLTDLTWSPDGLTLVASSTDGYCSFVIFTREELGEIYVPDENKEVETDKMFDNSLEVSHLVDSPKDKSLSTAKADSSINEKSPSTVLNVSDITESPISSITENIPEKKSPKMASIKTFFMSPKTIVKSTSPNLATNIMVEKEKIIKKAVIKSEPCIITLTDTPEKKTDSVRSESTLYKTPKLNGNEVQCMVVDEKEGMEIVTEKSKCKMRLDFSGSECEPVVKKCKISPKMSIKRFFMSETKPMLETEVKTLSSEKRKITLAPVSSVSDIPRDKSRLDKDRNAVQLHCGQSEKVSEIKLEKSVTEDRSIPTTFISSNSSVCTTDKSSMDVEKNAEVEIVFGPSKPVFEIGFNSTSQQNMSTLSASISNDCNMSTNDNDNMDVNKTPIIQGACGKNEPISKINIKSAPSQENTSVLTSLIASDCDISLKDKCSVDYHKKAGVKMQCLQEESASETVDKTKTCLSITPEPMIIFDENASGGDDTTASISQVTDKKAVTENENDWKLELSQDDDVPMDVASVFPEPKPAGKKVTPKRRIPFITLSSKTTMNK